MDLIREISPYLGAVSVVLTGLFAYWGSTRLEAFKSRLQQAELKLKGLLDHVTHVTKAQFDKEFSIYQQIWVSMVPLRSSTLSLRPVFDQMDSSESAQDRMRRRLKEFWTAFAPFRDIVEQHKPFYATEVYGSLDQIMQLCHKESIDYQLKNDVEVRNYWESQKKNREAITSAIDQCCELIRTRIGKLAVLE